VINPERRHREQIFIRIVLPSLTAFTLWRLGYQTFRVLLFAWLTLWPKTGPFPQISQTFAMAEPQKIFIRLTYSEPNCKSGIYLKGVWIFNKKWLNRFWSTFACIPSPWHLVFLDYPPDKILLTLEFKSARFDRTKDTFCYLKTISVHGDILR